MPVFIAHHHRRVVVDDEAVVANLLHRAYYGGHVERTLADKALVEPVALAFDGAEVDIHYLVARAEVADAPQDILGAAHLRPAANAEQQPPGRTVADELPGALEIVEARENAGHAADCFAGRIVGMKRGAYAGLLCDRQDCLRKI